MSREALPRRRAAETGQPILNSRLLSRAEKNFHSGANSTRTRTWSGPGPTGVGGAGLLLSCSYSSRPASSTRLKAPHMADW